MKWILSALLLLAACIENAEKAEPAKQVTFAGDQEREIQPVQDTVVSIFPIRIMNDKGRVRIEGVRTYRRDTLLDSYFIIRLEDIPTASMSRELDKASLIDSNEVKIFRDSIHADFTKEAIIRELAFEFVRSNTLYFTAVLENPQQDKVISGRFNLFYATKRKGTIYGWITDEIN